jgi:hypothetical protein
MLRQQSKPQSQSQQQPASTTRSASLHHPLRPQQEAPPPQAPPPTAHEEGIVAHYLAVRDRIHEGPFYTILNDGMNDGLKRKASEPAPTEASLFNPFSDNQTYSAKYFKVRRRLPKLDARPYGKSAPEKRHFGDAQTDIAHSNRPLPYRAPPSPRRHPEPEQLRLQEAPHAWSVQNQRRLANRAHDQG